GRGLAEGLGVLGGAGDEGFLSHDGEGVVCGGSGERVAGRSNAEPIAGGRRGAVVDRRIGAPRERRGDGDPGAQCHGTKLRPILVPLSDRHGEPPARAPGGSLERCNQLLGYAVYAGRAPRLGTHSFSAEGAKNLTGRLPGPGPRSAPDVAPAERLRRRHHRERASDMFTRVCAWDRTSFPTWTGRSAASG